MKAVPRLLLYTAAGYTNLGDDAVLEGALAVLRAAIPDATFVVAGGAALAPRAAELDVTVLDAYDWEALAGAIGECDAVLLGGGGLLYDHTFTPSWEDWARGHTAWLYQAPRLAMVARALGKPLALFSLGVGPLVTPLGRAFARYTAQQARLIVVRDPGSAALLQDLGIDAARLQVAPDVAAAAPGPDAPQVGVFGTWPRPWFAVNVRPWRDDERMRAVVAEAMGTLLLRTGGSALLLPFQRTPDDDVAVARAVARGVAERLGRPDRVAVATLDSPRAAMAAIAAADVAVVMRLHALWFAARAGVPTVALAYDPKVAELAGAFPLGVEAIPTERADAESLIRAALRLWEQRDALVSELRSAAASYAAHAGRTGQAVAVWLRAPKAAAPVSRTGEQVSAAWFDVPGVRAARDALAHESFALQEEVRRMTDQWGVR